EQHNANDPANELDHVHPPRNAETLAQTEGEFQWQMQACGQPRQQRSSGVDGSCSTRWVGGAPGLRRGEDRKGEGGCTIKTESRLNKPVRAWTLAGDDGLVTTAARARRNLR